MTAARTLTDADLAALREAMRDVVREEIGHAREALTDRPANSRPRAPLTVSETTSEAARLELERRGLRAPRGRGSRGPHADHSGQRPRRRRAMSDEENETERRAPVQGDLFPHRGGKSSGTISWSEHVEAWRAYSAIYGGSQSAERIAERGGFGHGELLMFLGRDPATFVRSAR